MPVEDMTFLAGVLAVGLILLFVGYAIGRKLTAMTVHREWEVRLPGLMEETRKRSRTVLTGLFSEQLTPYLPDFPYKPTEVRFIGNPVDFVVFKGLDKKEPTEVIFVEVKSQKSTLSSVERKVRDLVENKSVKWAEYRVPSNIGG